MKTCSVSATRIGLLLAATLAFESVCPPGVAETTHRRRKPVAPATPAAAPATTPIPGTNALPNNTTGTGTTPVPGSTPVSSMPLFVRAAPAIDALHLIIGGSMFVNTKQRMARVYVTNPSVIDAYTASPNQLLFTAKTPGLSSVVVWDETGATQSYLVSSDIDVDTLRNTLKQSLPHEDVQVQSKEGRIILTGTVSTAAVAEAAVKLANGYGKDISNGLLVNAAVVKQVRLKVRILEVDRSKLEQFGFNFFSTAGNTLAQSTTGMFSSAITTSPAGSSSSSNGTSVGGTTVAVTNPLNFLLYSAKLNVGATIQDLETRQVLQILAEPTITTLSGEKANFLAGGEFPFPVVQGSAAGGTSIAIQFRPYGVKLEFTPLVNPDGTISLKVAPEVSALDYANSVQINGYTIPALSTRKAETQVVLQSDQSFAISGLLDKNTTDSYGRTPGIASVPILGALFKSKQVNHNTTELIVIVTPTIVNPLAETLGMDQPRPAMPMLDSNEFDRQLPKPKPQK